MVSTAGGRGFEYPDGISVVPITALDRDQRSLTASIICQTGILNPAPSAVTVCCQVFRTLSAVLSDKERTE